MFAMPMPAHASQTSRFDEQICHAQDAEAVFWRERCEAGDPTARAVRSIDELKRWLVDLMVYDADEEALRVFDVMVAESLEDIDPLGEGAQDWPAELCSWPAEPDEPRATGSLIELEKDDAVTGWRMWDTRSGWLIAPFMAHHSARGSKNSRWKPGINIFRRCTVEGHHPRIDLPCVCGIRAVQSLSVLGAFSKGMENHPTCAPAAAIAKVRIWGRVAGPARGDDWHYTIRGTHAEIDGPIHLAEEHEKWADGLHRRYGNEVLVESDEIAHVLG